MFARAFTHTCRHVTYYSTHNTFLIKTEKGVIQGFWLFFYTFYEYRHPSALYF